MSKYGGQTGYSRYRGRTPRWKVVLAVVLVLVILLSGGLILMQKYLIYGDNGQKRLELPWGTEAPEHDAAEVPDLDIQEPEPAVTAHRAFAVKTAPLTLAALEAARQYGTEHQLDTPAVTLRRDGRVYFGSAKAVYQAVDTDAETAEALKQLTSGDSHAVGLFSCFRDPVAAQAKLDDMGLKNTGGYIFYDGNNQNWLDPAKPETVRYLSELLTECADLGFDEVVLQDFTFPTEGKLSKIAYTPEISREEALCAALKAFRTALDESGHKDTALSVELPAAAVLSGKDEQAGICLAELAKTADAIYVPAEQDQLPALKTAVEAAGTVRFVPVLPELPEGEEQPEGFLLVS